MREHCIDPGILSLPGFENRYGTWGQADFREHWQAWVRDDLTRFITALKTRMSVKKPWVSLSVAVKPDHEAAARDFYQDWPHWINANLVDFVCLMAYSNSIERILSEALRVANDPGKVAVGLGIYRHTPERIRAQVKGVAKHPFCGIVYFSYEELRKNTAFLYTLD